MRDLLAHSGECRLWLIAEGGNDGPAIARWLAWLRDAGLERVAAGTSLAELLGATDSVAS
ncbi:hypothetical protein [Variovorax paradoxus]|uniref:hypothetical protein n=1 Tax=Variovorax paradoxus TaxID=34073 RepID=UPI00247ABD31